MIISSTQPLEINKIYNENNAPIPFRWRDKNIKNFAILIIREATKEEFIECIKEMFPEDWHRFIYNKYYYEIHTD